MRGCASFGAKPRGRDMERFAFVKRGTVIRRKNKGGFRVFSLTENFHFEKSASIAFDRSNAIWAGVAKQRSKKTIQAEKSKRKGENPYILALFVLLMN